jgi:NitT/TauT family transport system ATP-binding protein
MIPQSAAAQGKLVVEDVSMVFSRGSDTHRVIDHVSLTVGDSEFVSLVGPSGCGKTTLLRIIAGLLNPTAGRVRVDGRLVAGPARDRAMVFQNDSLLPWRTVLGNVQFGLEVLRMPKAESSDRAKRLIELVGLEGFEQHYPRELSGGMRQRVNLARALAVDPALLLMDEPFAALDAQTREVMQLELMEIWASNKKTVAFVTHQIDEAVFLSDRVVVLAAHPGRILDDIRIDLPRPRAFDVKRTPAFAAYADKIWRLIEKQVFRSVREGA